MPLKSKIIQLSFKRSQPAGLARPFLIKNRLLMDYLFQLLDTDNSVGQSTFNNNLKWTTMTQQSTLLIIRFATAICDCDLRLRFARIAQKMQQTNRPFECKGEKFFTDKISLHLYFPQSMYPCVFENLKTPISTSLN